MAIEMSRRDALKVAGVAGAAASLASAGVALADAPAAKAGTYTATYHGHHSDVVTTVEIADGRIASFEADYSGETDQIAITAFNRIQKAVLDNQSFAVDTVAGATFTSNALLMGVEDCLRQAGGDEAVAAFQTPVEPEPWSDEPVELECDVCVIGTGIAGIVTALSAQEAGAKVVMLEKMPFWGGISQTSNGCFNIPNVEAPDGAEAAEERYIDYTLRMNCATMQGQGVTGDYTACDQYPDRDLMHMLAYNAYDDVQWFIGQGANLAKYGVVPIGDQSWMERLTFLFVTENGYFDPPHCASRGFKTLFDKLEENGAELYLETAAQRLLTDGGRVCGVYAEGPGGHYTVNAGAVVICAGGFGASSEMVEQYAPSYAGELNVTAVGNTGDGIRMAVEVGAATYDDGLMMGNGGHTVVTDYDMIHPYDDGETPYTAMYVNPQGLRVNSETPAVYQGGSTYVNPDSRDYYWVIINEANAAGIELSEEKAALAADGYGSLHEDNYLVILEDHLAAGDERFFKDDTLAGLARQIKVSPNTLRYTLNRYNAFCEEGVDEDFSKAADYLVAMPEEEGPWYAVKAYVQYFGTIGGIKINTSIEALDADGNPIPGLYAAGETANHGFFNLCYNAESMAACLVSGRAAGANAAAFARSL